MKGIFEEPVTIVVDDEPEGPRPGSSPAEEEEGLTTQQAQELRAQYGANEVTAKETPEWRKILKHYLGLIPILMLITAILSVAVESEDGRRGWVSFGLLIFELNLVALLGWYSDRNVGSALAELKKLSAPRCIARRDGKWAEIEVRDLVPGDVILLRGGDVVPADATIVGAGEPVQVDESSLTGESMAVSKDTGGEVLSGSVIGQGERHAKVTATGGKTFFGKTITLIQEGGQDSGHLQKVLNEVAYILVTIGTVGIIAILAVILARSDYPVGECFVISFVILVAVAPIGMPLVTTAVLAVGAREMAQQKAIVSRLSAMEEMSGMEVLCSDKTGTLTKNELHLEAKEVVPWGGVTVLEVLRYAALAARWENQDAIDKAVTAALENDPARLEGWEVTRFVPFNPVDKRTEATVTPPPGAGVSGPLLVSKGAPHIIRDMLDDLHAQDLVNTFIEEKARRGLRSLGVATSADGGETWVLAGLLAVLDPPREDSAETIRQAQALGLEVKMITGDQRAIAIETSRRLGLGTNIVPARELRGRLEGGDPGALADMVDGADGFAGVYPEHKFLIVQELQRKGRLVGMTGDGVNDAPALKKANVGIAVAGATEAAKAAADIILTAPGLSTIITAITRSRKIFRRLESYIAYRIASSTLILLFFFFALIVVQFNFPTWVLILLSLVNDFTVIATSRDKVYSSQEPQIWNMTRVLVVACAIGICTFTSSFLLLFLARPESWNWWPIFGIELAGGNQTRADAQVVAIIFLQLALMIQLNIFATRTPSFFWYFSEKTVPRPSLVLCFPVAASCLVATFIAVYWPQSARLGGGADMAGCGWGAAGIVWAWALLWFVIADVVKVCVQLAYAALSARQIEWVGILGGSQFTTPERTLRGRMAKLVRRKNRDRLLAVKGSRKEECVEDVRPRPGAQVDVRLEALERETKQLRAAVRVLLQHMGTEGVELLQRIQSRQELLKDKRQ